MAIAKTARKTLAFPELRQWMDDTGTTQAALASFAQVDQAQISRYLAGKTDLPVERAFRLSLVTGIPVEKLLNGREASRLLKLLDKRSKTADEKSDDSGKVA